MFLLCTRHVGEVLALSEIRGLEGPPGNGCYLSRLWVGLPGVRFLNNGVLFLLGKSVLVRVKHKVGQVPWHEAIPQQVSAAVPLITLDSLMGNTVKGGGKPASIEWLRGGGCWEPPKESWTGDSTYGGSGGVVASHAD